MSVIGVLETGKAGQASFCMFRRVGVRFGASGVVARDKVDLGSFSSGTAGKEGENDNMKYKWNSCVFKADANKVGKELTIIEATEDLTSSNILDYAKKHKSSELNKCFEWDDTIAGEKYRLLQANSILMSISIVSTDKQEPVKAFVNVKTSEEKRVFKSIVKVLENDEEYNQILTKAEKEFISYKEKYEKLIKMKDFKEIIIKNI